MESRNLVLSHRSRSLPGQTTWRRRWKLNSKMSITRSAGTEVYYYPSIMQRERHKVEEELFSNKLS